MRYWMVFDIESVPDAVMGRRWLGLADSVSDAQVRREMAQRRVEQTDGRSDFLKPLFHQVVAIAAALIDEQGIIRRLGPMGALHDDESVLLRDFFHVVEDLTPRLVGWNTSGFDLPTLLHRALAHGLAIPAYYRVPGYRKRYDEDDHLDLMDMMSGYGASPRASLDEMALLLKVPGKLDVDGRDVADLVEMGELERVRQYCSHDVLTTTLIFMHYAHHRGWLDDAGRSAVLDSAWQWISEDASSQWTSFREAWRAMEAT